jgi:hypothetical protein
VAGVAPTGWVNPAHLGQLLPELDELVDAIDARGDAARQKLRARKGLVDPEAADAQQKVKAIADAAKELRLWLDEQRQGAGALLFEGVERARKKGKKAGLAAVGYCLNPGAWGGCQGEDRTDEVLALLEGDKRLLKSLQKALEELGEPEL